MDAFYIKGDFISADRPDKLNERPDCFLRVENGRIEGFYDKPQAGFPVLDYTDKLIIPSFTDIHVHAAQYPNLGLGMDMPLLPWLNTYTFPLEAKFADPNYAKIVYPRFIHDLWENGSLRSCIYASTHRESTEILMDLLIDSGLAAYVGKVNMNRNSPDGLCETLEDSLNETRLWLSHYAKASLLIKPIITPRFVPSVTPELMDGLAQLSLEFDVPIQSHLNENEAEIAWVKELHPEADNYLNVYARHELIKNNATIMAHCIYNEAGEVDQFASDGIFVAHCPTSNLNMASGMMPAAKLLRSGKINMALGSDIAGGNTLSMPRCITAAMQVSNMLFVLTKEDKPLSLAEAFWMATRGSGKFFGNAGDFTVGASCDLLVIDDSEPRLMKEMTLPDRLSRFIFAGDKTEIKVRMLEGKELPEPPKEYQEKDLKTQVAATGELSTTR